MTRFRFAEQSDAPALIQLWTCTFGDSKVYVKNFLEHFGYGIGVVADIGGIIAGAAYLIPTSGLLIPDQGTFSCCYIYAVAVAPEFRGRGLGLELTREATVFSRKLGYEYAALKPSSEALFGFYRKLGFETFSYSNELRFMGDIRKSAETGDLSEIVAVSPQDYIELREKVLCETVHVVPSEAEIEYQAKLGKLCGLRIGGSNGCAAIELHGRGVQVKELIFEEKLIDKASALIKDVYPALRYKFTFPAYSKARAIPSGMICPPLKNVKTRAFLGIAYD